MRVLIFGAGPIGQRHARNAAALGHEVALARYEGASDDGGETGAWEVVSGLEESGRWRPEAVVVANPPTAHLDYARWSLERDCSVLVEKPLAAGPAGVDELVELAAARGLHLAVGYNLRFHPAVAAVEQAVSEGVLGRLLNGRIEAGSYLPEWHARRDYRTTSAARAELGGGALLTLSHELDLALWIAGRAELVSGIRTKVSDLDIDTDDTAELVLRHASGSLTSIHMDLLDRSYNRRSRWVGEKATLEWTWGDAVWLRGAESTVLWQDEGFDLNETYVAELEAFLARRPPPGDALDDARRVLEIAAQVTWR